MKLLSYILYFYILGTWLYGVKHGKGRQTFPDDTYYEGEFAKGFEHGQGKRKYLDGTIYEGRFRFGRRDVS